MKPMKEAGFVLLQMAVAALILQLIILMLLQMSLFGRTLTARQGRSLQGRAVAETAYERAAKCLAVLNAASCSVPGSCAACGYPCGEVFGAYNLNLPGPHGGNFAVNVSLAGSWPSCTISAACIDCRGTVVAR